MRGFDRAGFGFDILFYNGRSFFNREWTRMDANEDGRFLTTEHLNAEGRCAS